MLDWLKPRGSARKRRAVTGDGDPEARPAPPRARGAVAIDEARRAASLEAELERERQRSALAATRAAEEAAVARRAVERATDALEQRDEFRRVLAAAIANERAALAEAAREREARAALETTLHEAERERGAAEGRAKELDRRAQELIAVHSAALADAHDRAGAEREERRREAHRLAFEAGEARARCAALEARAAAQDAVVPGSARLQASIATAASVFSAVLGIALAPLALFAAFMPSRAAYLTLALGLGPWGLALSSLGLLLLALGLAMLAARAERRPRGGPAGGAPKRVGAQPAPQR